MRKHCSDHHPLLTTRIRPQHWLQKSDLTTVLLHYHACWAQHQDLPEWLEHHKRMGVTKWLVWDDRSEPPLFQVQLSGPAVQTRTAAALSATSGSAEGLSCGLPARLLKSAACQLSVQRVLAGCLAPALGAGGNGLSKARARGRAGRAEGVVLQNKRAEQMLKLTVQ
jgi:hypothetical protein